MCCRVCATITVLGFLKEAILAFSAFAVGIAAMISIFTWRQQIKDKTHYGLARQLLRTAFEIETAFRHVRNPFMSSGELESALCQKDYERLKEDTDGRIIPFGQMQVRYAYSLRMKRLQEALIQFEADTIEARIVWGDDVTKYYDRFNKLVKKLYASLMMYLENLDGGDPKIRKASFDIIYGVSDGSAEDPFANEVKTVLGGLREYLMPFLEIRKKRGRGGDVKTS